MSRTYTLQDLQSRSLSELHALRGALYRELALAPRHSPEARETLTSLDAVSRVIRQRTTGPRMG
jgi:hypothetical protein